MNEMQNTKFVNVTPPAAIVDDASFTTAAIDTAGYDYLTVVCQLGATDIAMTALKLQESDASGSGYADISGATFDGGSDIEGTADALPAADEDNGLFIFQVDMRGKKRYVDLVATAGNGSTGTFMSVVAILSKAGIGPDTVSEHGATGFIRV